MDASIDRTLRTCHRTVLAMIGACAIAAALSPGTGAEPQLDPKFTTAAVGLALATVVSRRVSTSPVISIRTALALLLCAWVSAFALSLLGAFIAMSEGEKQVGLVYALAAAIFCLRPPAPLADRV